MIYHFYYIGCEWRTTVLALVVGVEGGKVVEEAVQAARSMQVGEKMWVELFLATK